METPQPKSNNPLLVLLLIVAAFAIGVLWQKNQSLSTAKPTETTNQNSVTPTTSNPLSVDKLKVYAQDMKLDTKKFNACLDESKYKDRISKYSEYGTSVGVAGTPGFFVNGRFIGGAFPFEWFKEIIDKEIAGTGSEDITTYSKNLQDVAKQGGFDPKKKNIVLDSDDPILGPTTAKVTIVEFSDFQCPFCVQAYPTVKQILDTYKDSVKFVYKQFPLNSIHPYAQKAAEASLCAHEQGKFFEYYDKLFGNQQKS